MERDISPELTAAEVGLLWSHYLGNSLTKCVLKVFLAKAADREIEPVLRCGYEVALRIDASVAALLSGDGYALPRGFGDEDVDCGAPRLFADADCLYYVKRVVRLALPETVAGLTSATRADVREFFSLAVRMGEDLDNRATYTLLSKGLYVRPPCLPAATVTRLAGEGFMGSAFGRNRPLLALETAHIFANMTDNVLGSLVAAGFSQVARAKELRSYFLRGTDIADKHVKVLADLLAASGLKAPMTWNALPTRSQTPPFSDRLMLALALSATAMGLGNYGLAMAGSMRADLTPLYARLMAEMGAYLADGTALMIGNGWLEEPPGAPDRAALALAGR